MSVKVHRLSMGMSLAYLIEAEAGLVLVDAGLRGREHRVMQRMRDLGRDDLNLIFITHAHLDHYGSAAALQRLTGAPIAVHRADGDAMRRGETRLGSARGWGRLIGAALPLAQLFLRPEPTAADLLLDDRDHLGDYGLDARVLHTPGHTVGSTCLLLGEGLAFVGDLVTSTGRPHLQRYFAEEWSLLAESLGRLQNRRPDLIYPGHGPKPITGDQLQQLEA